MSMLEILKTCEADGFNSFGKLTAILKNAGDSKVAVIGVPSHIIPEFSVKYSNWFDIDTRKNTVGYLGKLINVDVYETDGQRSYVYYVSKDQYIPFDPEIHCTFDKDKALEQAAIVLFEELKKQGIIKNNFKYSHHLKNPLSLAISTYQLTGAP